MISILAPITLAAAQAATSVAADAEEPECVKPTLVDRESVTPTEFNASMQRAQAYVTCMSSAIERQGKLANETLARAKAAAEKNNTMVSEVNAFVAEVKAYQDKHSGG